MWAVKLLLDINILDLPAVLYTTKTSYEKKMLERLNIIDAKNKSLSQSFGQQLKGSHFYKRRSRRSNIHILNWYASYFISGYVKDHTLLTQLLRSLALHPMLTSVILTRWTEYYSTLRQRKDMVCSMVNISSPTNYMFTQTHLGQMIYWL